MTYEHEAMHAETLLYMLIQSPSTLPPTSNAIPQWDVLARQWAQGADDNKILTIPSGSITMGHDDLEVEDGQLQDPKEWEGHQFGWDNEHPLVRANVAGFKVDALPISNADYLAFARETGLPFAKQQGNNGSGGGGLSDEVKETAPASWIWDGTTNEWKVRTLYGAVGMDVAGKWPLQASKCEVEAYAKHKGGRLPTESELRLFWENEQGSRPAGEMANVGFKNWHPVP